MSERLTVSQYLRGPEEMDRQELVWGFVLREPAPSALHHQSAVTRALVLLGLHVTPRQLGKVLVSPTDVVLDEEKDLVLQPDVVFISQARLHIIRERVWGAPDLVVEVLSPRTRRRDCTDKRRWYRKYGVREYWIVDPRRLSIDVLSFGDNRRTTRRTFHGSNRVRSTLLPDFDTRAETFFE